MKDNFKRHDHIDFSCLVVTPPQFLYKYRACNEKNIKALLENEIYVPRGDKLNDPKEVAFQFDIKNEELIKVGKIMHEYSKKGCYLLSFGLDKANITLWEKYSENFTGFVIEYSFYSICNEVTKTRKGFAWGPIIYGSSGGTISEEILKEYKKYMYSNCELNLNNNKILFTKDTRWCEEKEYRFAFGIEKPKDIDFINDY